MAGEKWERIAILFLDAISSPSSFPCQSVGESLIVSDWRLLSHLRALPACLIIHSILANYLFIFIFYDEYIKNDRPGDDGTLRSV